MTDNQEFETKTFGAFEVKDAEVGEVMAIVATLGVVDKDGDVLLPGSFPASAPVKMSGYSHDVVLDGAAPVGKGTITVDGDKAVFRGKFFLSTQRGRESFNMVKELGAEGEWSFGYPRGVQTMALTDDWRAKGARRLITGLQPIEASPVFVGAGVGTGTLMTKAVDTVLESGNPYDLIQRGNEYCVVKKDGGATVGCHATHAEALAQFRAVEMAYQQEKAAALETEQEARAAVAAGVQIGETMTHIYRELSQRR